MDSNYYYYLMLKYVKEKRLLEEEKRFKVVLNNTDFDKMISEINQGQ